MGECTKISSKEELDALIAKHYEETKSSLECFILLNWGIRSSKNIDHNPGEGYYVYNLIDDTEDFIEESSFKESIIGEALEKGKLYKYND